MVARQNRIHSQQQQHMEMVIQKDQLIAAMEQTISEKEEAAEIIELEKSQLQMRLESQQAAHEEEMTEGNHDQITSNMKEATKKNDDEIGALTRAIK